MRWARNPDSRHREQQPGISTPTGGKGLFHNHEIESEVCSICGFRSRCLGKNGKPRPSGACIEPARPHCTAIRAKAAPRGLCSYRMGTIATIFANLRQAHGVSLIDHRGRVKAGAPWNRWKTVHNIRKIDLSRPEYGTGKPATG